MFSRKFDYFCEIKCFEGLEQFDAQKGFAIDTKTDQRTDRDIYRTDRPTNSKRDREREKDKQASRQEGRHTDLQQKNSKRDKDRERKTDITKDKRIYGQRDTLTIRQTDGKQKGKQTPRETVILIER